MKRIMWGRACVRKTYSVRTMHLIPLFVPGPAVACGIKAAVLIRLIIVLEGIKAFVDMNNFMKTVGGTIGTGHK